MVTGAMVSRIAKSFTNSRSNQDSLGVFLFLFKIGNKEARCKTLSYGGEKEIALKWYSVEAQEVNKKRFFVQLTIYPKVCRIMKNFFVCKQIEP